MTKRRTIHRCESCGATSPTWVGRCPGCAAWGTLVEDVADVLPAARPSGRSAAVALPITEGDADEAEVRPTGIAELDRVLGGGLVPGSVTLVGGEPGIGKSTLLTQLAGTMAAAGERVLYVSGEESREQVRRRAARLGALVEGVWLVSETSLPDILTQLDAVKPGLLLVDSVQTLDDPAFDSAPGSVAQVRSCAHQLVVAAKERGVAALLVGHVTKDGTLAGPRVLEHVVDTVLSFEGDRHHSLRLLRALKHRFGATGELGLFELGDAGLAGVPDAGALFLADRRSGLPGSSVAAAMEGSRPLLVELQALVVPESQLPQPRRSAQGLDPGRLAVVLAVLGQHASVSTARADVFALVAGGVRVVEPAADLALALAVASAVSGEPLPPTLVACGEVGLGGEVRQVAHTGRRLGEAARLGFTWALVPPSAPEPPFGMQAIRVSTLRAAVELVGAGKEAAV